MKAMCFTVLCIYFFVECSQGFKIVANVNYSGDVNCKCKPVLECLAPKSVDGLISTVEAILNHAVTITVEVTGRLEDAVISIGDSLDLSGLTEEVEQVEQIVLRQVDGTLTLLLKRVSGLVFKVVKVVPDLVKTLLSGVESTVSLLGKTEESVEVDVCKVTQLLLKTADGLVSLVLKLV